MCYDVIINQHEGSIAFIIQYLLICDCCKLEHPFSVFKMQEQI